MQKLVQLLIRYNVALLFSILQGISFILVINLNEEQGAIFTAMVKALFKWLLNF